MFGTNQAPLMKKGRPIRAIRADTLRVGPHRYRHPAASAIAGALTGDGIIPPGIAALIGAAGGFFPLGFGGQAAAAPLAVFLRIVPGDIHHGVLIPDRGIKMLPILSGAASRFQAVSVAVLRHFVDINIIIIQINRVAGLGGHLIVISPHHEFTGGHQHHWHVVGIHNFFGQHGWLGSGGRRGCVGGRHFRGRGEWRLC